MTQPSTELVTTEVQAARPLDPYLQWALSTDFRGYRATKTAKVEWLSFIGRVAKGVDVDHFLARYDKCEWIHFPPIYRMPLKGTSTLRRYVTGAVHKDHLNEFLRIQEFARFELGLPVATPATRQTTPSAGSVSKDLGSRPRGEAAGNVIGIIDYGGPFLHPSFRRLDTGLTRFFSVWDQGTGLRGNYWHVPEGLSYGRELDEDDINILAGEDKPPMQIYADLEYTLDRDDTVNKRVLRDTHGAHVCDMLTGNVDPLQSVRVGRGIPSAPGTPDAAAQAQIIFVQIPLPTLIDSSGGSLNVHILDGIRYILDRAATSSNIVVNISYGQNGGPHDGSSLLEEAMDDLIDATQKRLVLVIGAGNGREDRAHATLNLSVGTPQVLSWKVPPNDVTDSFLEIWYPSKIDETSTDLSIEVRPPGGIWSPALTAKVGSVHEWTAGPQNTVVAQLVHSDNVPNGQGAMALLSLAPTKVIVATSIGTVPAPVGVWDIRLSTKMLGYSVPVHAWIEREDLPDTMAQSEFVSHVSDAGTLNGIATGEHCIVVGGIRSSDMRPAPYSALGPKRSPANQGMSPVVFAECEESEALYGIRAGTMMPGNTLRMGGTSVAAPAAARQIFNAIATIKSPNAQRDLPDSPTTAKRARPALTTAQALISAAGRVLRDKAMKPAFSPTMKEPAWPPTSPPKNAGAVSPES